MDVESSLELFINGVSVNQAEFELAVGADNRPLESAFYLF
jgi:hypothetical protein